jgi:hypothetical protein
MRHIVVCFDENVFSSDEIASIWSSVTKDSGSSYRLLPYVWVIFSSHCVKEIVEFMRNSSISVDYVNVFEANINIQSHLPRFTYSPIDEEEGKAYEDV